MLRSAGAVAAITLLSRVAGLVRDQVFAIFFGATLVSDAYVAAFSRLQPWPVEISGLAGGSLLNAAREARFGARCGVGVDDSEASRAVDESLCLDPL